MTAHRLMPGVFTEARHLVLADARAYRSSDLGIQYRALCNALCLAQPAGRYTWCGWPLCSECDIAAAQPVVALLTDVPVEHIERPRLYAA